MDFIGIQPVVKQSIRRNHSFGSSIEVRQPSVVHERRKENGNENDNELKKCQVCMMDQKRVQSRQPRRPYWIEPGAVFMTGGETQG